MAVFTRFLFMISLLGLFLHETAAAEQCNGPRQLPIRGKMLKGHIFETRWIRSGYEECLFACREKILCQSFNFVTNERKCEFNNRTKEACNAEDFVQDHHSLYVKLDVSRVPLGSISELPAKSCQEIKANEGRKIPSNKYWFSLIPGKSVLAYCDMETDDIDECSASPPLCTNGICKNTIGSYSCSCDPGFTGNEKTCSDIDECAGDNLCDASAICTNTAGSYRCTCKTPEYYGDGRNCKYARGLNSSTILTSTELPSLAEARVKLSSYLNPVVQDSIRSRFVRCWQASKDGWAASVFHRNCDGKGPTVTIVNANKFIFGGYSDVSWFGYARCSYASSSKAFIFSLHNNYNYPYIYYNPVKLEIKSSSLGRAIYRCASYGPTFGDGHDLYISDNAQSNTNSYTLPSFYTTPPGCSPEHSCTFFAGSSYFIPTDVEVFYETTI